jgi:hypothetical protein
VASEPDLALTAALAEYEHLREASKAVHDQSTARFTFFLAVASAATATAAGVLGTGRSTGLRPVVVAGLGLRG